jgi:hypothetical protein
MHEKKHLWKDNVAVQVISWTKKMVVLLSVEEATNVVSFRDDVFQKY